MRIRNKFTEEVGTKTKKWIRELFNLTSRRNLIFLPKASLNEESYLSVIYSYRVTDSAVVEIREESSGKLSLELKCLRGRESIELASIDELAYSYEEKIVIDFKNGIIKFSNSNMVIKFTPLSGSRRYQLDLSLCPYVGMKKKRTCSFYLVTDNAINEDYFQGSNYFDYELQAQGDAVFMAQWIRSWMAPCKILEIGCGSGLALLSLKNMDFECYGVDIAKWAVDQASTRIGRDRIGLCDVENRPLPFHETFDAVLMSAVLEHFHHPYNVLSNLSKVTKKGSLIFIRTANPDSLTHLLFKRNWEGYFDYSHFGVDQVSPSQLRLKLPQLGWKILSLQTDSIWAMNNDEVTASLRDYYGGDARFRVLIKELELGDFVSIVAKKIK